MATKELLMKQKNKDHSFAGWLLLVTSSTIIFSFVLSVSIFGLIRAFNFKSLVTNTTIYFLFVLGISLIIDLMIIAIYSKPVTNSLQKVKNAMRAVSKGKFDTKLSPVKNQVANELITDFNTMVDELNSNKLMKTDFISNFSHEFKTPIVSIHGFAKILLDNPNLPVEQKQEYLQIIVEQSERLSNLASNTLLISKLNSKTIIEKTTFSLDEHMRESILLFSNIQNYDLQINLDEVSINANKELLSQVWINLIGNAIKYANKQISISLTKQDNTAIVEFKNDGTTITDEQAERIFDKFYQADNSHNTKGFGLGLSIAKKIINLHNGSISCNNKQKNTTIFTIKLPLD